LCQDLANGISGPKDCKNHCYVMKNMKVPMGGGDGQGGFGNLYCINHHSCPSAFRCGVPDWSAE
jgi:hypothetical protein